MKRSSSLVPALAIVLTALTALGVAAGSARFRSWLPDLKASAKISSPQKASSQTQRRTPRTLENFDIRADQNRSLAARPERARDRFAAQAATQPRLLQMRRRVQARWNSLTATPSRVFSDGQPLSAPDNDDAETLTRRFLRENSDLYRLSEQDLNGLRASRRDRTAHNGLTHLTLQQRVSGIEVFQSRLTAHLDRNGAIIATTGDLLPDAARLLNRTQPRLSATDALNLAAGYADTEIRGAAVPTSSVTGEEQRQTFAQSIGFERDVNARLVAFPLSAELVRLAWEFELWLKETPDAYLIVIDAERGSLLYRYNLTCYEENPLRPHGLIYTGDSPRPDSPHTSDNPPTVERVDKPFRAESFNGSAIFSSSDPHNDWWAGAVADTLVSNNVDAHLDRDANNQPDLPLLRAGDGNFSFPIDFTQPPFSESNQKAALANLFYWTNRYHDVLYSFGFTESAGNFQTRNFNLGGAENDAVQAEAQDGGGTNNANFSTPPDGRPGRVQMYLWSGSPQLDGDLDQTVILHEMTHGLSNRLIGNSTGLSGFQARGMGEGWSDYFSLVLLRSESDPLDGAYAVGQYVRNNYALGIRRYPYSTNKDVYPLTFARISLSTSVHAAGEIWCVALWELRALLIQKYGFQEGQRQSLQLVVDGLKLTPPEPTFLEARDAILLADRVSNGGANQCLLWQAFAKRGMGFSAATSGVSDTAPKEAFDQPPYCSDSATLQLDKRNYVIGEAMRITLGDRNAITPAQARLKSSITNDQETITLEPDQIISGSFQASMRLAAGRANAGDGILQASVEAGDEITVSYDDAENTERPATTVTERAGVVREKTIFEDNIENGNQGWTASGAWAIVGSRSASSTHAWTDSPAGGYSNNSDSPLTSPLFDFSNLSEVTLTIAHSFDLENRYDFGIVEFSADDGATWTKAAAFTGSQAGFIQSRISLEGLSGQARARIRFRLLSDQSVTGDGWFIDDVRLIARSASPAVIKPASAPAPVISSISPAFSSPAGGTQVTISGINFTDNEDTIVTFDNLPATAVNVTGSTTLTAIVPAHSPGAVTVRLSNRHGSAALSGGFTYYQNGSAANSPAPKVDRLFPLAGSTRGGTVVTLIGENFTPETTVTFNAWTASVTFVNANTLRVITPAMNTVGAVDLTTANGAHQTNISNAFTYTQPTPPVAQLLTPNGGDSIFIGSTISIRWQSSDNSSLIRHRLALVRNTGAQFVTVAEIASELPGNAHSFNWTIPSTIEPTTQARIRVTAIDDEGAETEAMSSGDFTIARRWNAVAQLPFPLQRLQAVSDGQFIYAIGGRTTSASSTTVETVSRFDPTSGQWTTVGIAPIPMGLSSGEAVYLNGKIFVPGGFTSASATPAQQHYVYDVAGNAWSMRAAVPAISYFYALAADETRGVYYQTGGNNNLGGAVAIVRAYDAQADAWSDLPPMKAARYGHEAALIEGKLYVIGGFGVTGGLSSGEVFDFSTQQWTAIASLNRSRRFAASSIVKDSAGNPYWLVGGGEDPVTGLPVSTVEAYDVRRNRWIALDSSFNQPVPRTQLAAAAVQGNLYTIGGAAFQGSFTTLTTVPTVERLRLEGFTPVSTAAPPSLAVPLSQVALVNREISFSVSASNLNSAVPITIAAEGLPERASFTTATITNNNTRGEFRWTPAGDDLGKNFLLTFTASNDGLSDTRSVLISVIQAAPLAVVSAASYRGETLAPDSIVAAFGTNLAVKTETAQTLPLPLELSGTSVTVNGVPAPLFFVSPNQINFAMPPGIDTGSSGAATIIVRSPLGNYALGDSIISPAQPALFTADSTGQGDAAALSTLDGVSYQPAPFAVSVNGRSNILVLYGTGFRNAQAGNPEDGDGVAEAVTATIGGAQARVLYAGAQGQFVGLDQLNLELPPGLADPNRATPLRAEIIVSVNGAAANRVSILIR